MTRFLPRFARLGLAATMSLFVPPSASAAPDGGRGMALLGAYVLSSGSLHHGSGATAAERPSTGHYTITFNRDIVECFYTTIPIISDRFVKIQGYLVADHNTLVVETTDATGTMANTLFSVIVFCPK